MAYVLPTEEEERNEREAAKAPVGGPMLGGGAAPAAPVGGSAQPAKTSTSFVSYDRVLGANKDAAKSYALKTAQPLQKAGQASRSAVTGATNAFAGKVQAGMPAAMQTAPYQGKPAATPQPTGKTADPYAALSNQKAPTTTMPGAPKQSSGATTVQSQGTVSGTTLTPEQAKAQAGWTYGGPESMAEDAGWGDILSGASDATRKVGLTSDRTSTGELQGESGLQTLLEEQVGGNYTKGQSKLDAALLGTTGRSYWDGLQSEYGDLLGEAKRANEASKGVASTAKANVATQADSARAALGQYDADAAATEEANNAAMLASDKRERDRLAMEAAAAERGAFGQGPGFGGHNTSSIFAQSAKGAKGAQQAWERMDGAEYAQLKALYDKYLKAPGTNDGEGNKKAVLREIEQWVAALVAKYAGGV